MSEVPAIQGNCRCYVSVNSKPDHPPGQTPGNFLKGRIPTPGQKESAKPQPLGQKNRAKTPSPGQLISKTRQKTYKT